MKPEMILQADVLDIIFDNRNKEYGAYELRSHYNSRLKKSIVIIFSGIVLLIGASVLISHFFPKIKKELLYVGPDIQIIDPPTIDKPPKPKPVQRTQPVRQVAQTEFKTPVITRQEIVKPMATQKELSETLISNKTVAGDNSNMNELPSLNVTSKGNGNEEKSQAAIDENKVVEYPDYMPEFPGGQEALQRFLGRNLRMPKQDLEPGTKIATLVRFIIDKDGRVTGIEFEKSGGSDFDNEVSRVMKKMPVWKPGMQGGRNVAVYFKLPVIFQVPDEN